MKKMRTIALFLCLCMLATAFQITGIAGADSPSGTGAAAQAGADAYDVVIGDVRVQLLSGSLARVEVRGPKGFEDRETYHITGRDWDGTPYTTQTVGDLIAISTENYVVYVPTEAKALDGVYMTDRDGKVIWA